MPRTEGGLDWSVPVGMSFTMFQTHANVGRLYTDCSKPEGCLPGLKRVCCQNWVALKRVWFQPWQRLSFSYSKTKSESQTKYLSLSGGTTQVIITAQNVRLALKQVCEEGRHKESEQFNGSQG